MSISVIDIGDIAELKGAFTDPETGDPVEPESVVCTVRKPNGSIVTPTVTVAGGGVFIAEIEVDRAGSWLYAFDGTGGYQASGEREFRARSRRVTR